MSNQNTTDLKQELNELTEKMHRHSQMPMK